MNIKRLILKAAFSVVCNPWRPGKKKSGSQAAAVEIDDYLANILLARSRVVKEKAPSLYLPNELAKLLPELQKITALRLTLVPSNT